MKFRIPSNCGALSHGGAAVEIRPDACVELDASQVDLLRPHGLDPIDAVEVEISRIGTMSNAELVAALRAHDVAMPRDARDKTLRSLLRRALAGHGG